MMYIYDVYVSPPLGPVLESVTFTLPGPVLEKVHDSIRSTLPGLSSTALNKVMEKLRELKVQQVNDLELVREEDISPPLEPMEVRRLMRTWKYVPGEELCVKLNK